MIRKNGQFCTLFFLISAIGSLSYNYYEDEDQIRILGGTDADDGAFPYQVSLRLRGRHFCAGSIIGDSWILTAAHCLRRKKLSRLTVVAGTNSLNSQGDTYKVQKVIPHELHSPKSHDIALVKLQGCITMKKTVQKVALPTSDSAEGADVVLSGWGYTSYPGKASLKLQALELMVVGNDWCAEFYPGGKIKNSTLCTFGPFGEGACKGDSGGPLVSWESGEQVGVMSWGIPCAKGKPDVFTRVYSYVGWIKKNMQ